MKYLFTTLAIITSLSLSAQATEEKCNAETKGATCNEAAATKVEANAHSKGGHGDLATKMNSFLPEKQPNSAMAATPSVPTISAPAFLANVTAGPVKLEWKASTGASDYHLQVATDPNFKWLVVNEKFVKTTSFDFTAETGKRYFWRVAGFKADNNASFTKSNFVGSAFNVK